MLVSDVTRALAEKKELACVLVESCSTRWNSSEKLKEELNPWQLRAYSNILANEIQMAAAVAKEYDIKLVLGDQPIEVWNPHLNASCGYKPDALFPRLHCFPGHRQAPERVRKRNTG